MSAERYSEFDAVVMLVCSCGQGKWVEATLRGIDDLGPDRYGTSSQAFVILVLVSTYCSVGYST